MEKQLDNLNPSWVAEKGHRYAVHFDCPACQVSHGIVVPFLIWSDYKPDEHHIWELTGDLLPNISLSPSVDATRTKKGVLTGCIFHGHVTNGKVTW